MARTVMAEKLEHSPTLNTVLMVEETIKNAKNSVITIPEIKRALPRQVNHRTLMVILEYLEGSGKIVVALKGITWIYNSDQNLRRAINRGLEL